MTPKNLYYSLASLGSLLGMIISFGIAINSFIDIAFYPNNYGSNYQRRSVIEGLVRGAIFLGVFFTHYKYVKNQK